MGTVVCNVAKGRMVEFYNRVLTGDPAGARLVVEPISYSGSAATDAQIADVDDHKSAWTLLGLFTSRSQEALSPAYTELAAADLSALTPNDATDSFDISLPTVTIDIGKNGVPGLYDPAARIAIFYAPIGYVLYVTDAGVNNMIPMAFADFVAPAHGDADDIIITFNANFLQES